MSARNSPPLPAIRSPREVEPSVSNGVHRQIGVLDDIEGARRAERLAWGKGALAFAHAGGCF